MQNLHTHTTFCDGNNSVLQMAAAAEKAGLTSLGFSSHAYTPHDESYCMKYFSYGRYLDEVMKARVRYKGTLDIYIGLEQDFYSAAPNIDVDYIIGSVHYVEKDGVFTPVDETRGDIERALTELYGGDIYAFLERYFSIVENVHDKTRCDIVGHIDLCEKFNNDGTLFDRAHPRYIAAYKKAVDKLAAQGCIFEINTGAMSRGYTDFPYPHENILNYIAAVGGKITVSSDSHSVDTVDYKLDKMCELARKCGFDGLYTLTESGFVKELF